MARLSIHFSSFYSLAERRRSVAVAILRLQFINMRTTVELMAARYTCAGPACDVNMPSGHRMIVLSMKGRVRPRLWAGILYYKCKIWTDAFGLNSPSLFGRLSMCIRHYSMRNADSVYSLVCKYHYKFYLNTFTCVLMCLIFDVKFLTNV